MRRPTPSVYTPPGPPATWPGDETPATTKSVPDTYPTRGSSSSYIAISNYTCSVCSTTRTIPVPYIPSNATSTSTEAYYTSTITTTSSAAPDNACASVRSLALQVSATSPKATPTVPAALAYECINSVPFNQSAAGKSGGCLYRGCG